MARPRNEALLNSGTLSPNPWDLTLSGQNVCWRYTEATRTEDKAPQGCDLSVDSSAGMAPGGLDAEAVSIQNQTRRILAYCHPRMVLTMGSTLDLEAAITHLAQAIRESDARITHDPMPTLPVDRGHHISAEQKGTEWVISIRDNGIGFDPQYASIIFAPFKRLHTAEEYPGNWCWLGNLPPDRAGARGPYLGGIATRRRNNRLFHTSC